jgi:hypothetical protein
MVIVSALRSYLKSIKRFRLESFSVKLDENSRGAMQEAVLAPFIGDLSPTQLEEEFGYAVKSVKLARLMKERRGIIARVREAEKSKNSPEIRRLEKEILKLTERIESL